MEGLSLSETMDTNMRREYADRALGFLCERGLCGCSRYAGMGQYLGTAVEALMVEDFQRLYVDPLVALGMAVDGDRSDGRELVTLVAPLATIRTHRAADRTVILPPVINVGMARVNECFAPGKVEEMREGFAGLLMSTPPVGPKREVLRNVPVSFGRLQRFIDEENIELAGLGILSRFYRQFETFYEVFGEAEEWFPGADGFSFHGDLDELKAAAAFGPLTPVFVAWPERANFYERLAYVLAMLDKREVALDLDNKAWGMKAKDVDAMDFWAVLKPDVAEESPNFSICFVNASILSQYTLGKPMGLQQYLTYLAFMHNMRAMHVDLELTMNMAERVRTGNHVQVKNRGQAGPLQIFSSVEPGLARRAV